MHQLTIRGFGPELEERLRDLARERRISLNKAALLLMRRGAGLEAANDRPGRIGSALDDFVGTWTEDEARSFLESIEVFEQIDEELWR
jgi:hypothetical protein